MSTRKISNIPLKDIRKILEKYDVKHHSTNGGHEKWTANFLLRPIILQTHIDPVPPRIVQQIIRHLCIDKDEFFSIYDSI